MITYVGKTKNWLFTRLTAHWQSIKDKVVIFPGSIHFSQNGSWCTWSLHPNPQGRATQTSPKEKAGNHTEWFNYCLNSNTVLKLHYLFLHCVILLGWLRLSFFCISYLRSIISFSFSFLSSLSFPPPQH